MWTTAKRTGAGRIDTTMTHKQIDSGQRTRRAGHKYHFNCLWMHSHAVTSILR